MRVCGEVCVQVCVRVLTSRLLFFAVQSHSFTAVVSLSCIFLFLTISITVAVVVFCKKKNTVFSLQKCEEEDEVRVWEGGMRAGLTEGACVGAMFE